MSLTLNDEQERALREWYAWAVSPMSGPGFFAVNHPRRLADAIAPLMKKWRTERHPGGAPYIHGGNATIDVNGLGCHGSMELAERICDLLNRTEENL